MTDRPLAILQMGRPPEDLRATHGEQADWVTAALAGIDVPLTVVYPADSDALPDPARLRGAVLTGSWAMVTDREPWSERTAQWLRDALRAQLPLLGICYGHQLMAHAFGGVVGYHPQGREIGLHTVQRVPASADDPLLTGLPDRFAANLTHEQSVLQPPAPAVVLAGTAHDPHQILRYGPQALSVQFHPEFTPAVMDACLARRQDVFAGEGHDVAALRAALAPTPHARQILRGFATACAR
ncbi:glutamine amidotransferase [Achromobacter sp. UMC71]|uniref:glutamine amidotransferase n=1 Tax=Achromobacter sp. UMC71 TaxID=1862320 RepID=UPI0015FECEFD|nr:glutamine amidotransferase [Achromobacter sp. UMC71]MBB1627167.1 GMP synthase [Achromobacter sp. UMC71]